MHYCLAKNRDKKKMHTPLQAIEEKHLSFQEGRDQSFNWYLSGFVDGEGCFSVSFSLRKKMNTGIEVKPSFCIAQRKSAKHYHLLKKIRDLFQCGAIRDDGKGCYKYETRSLASIRANVIPFFQKYPLFTDKAQDFSFFSEICSLMAGQQHLSKKGLARILQLSKQMNSSGIRRYSIESLQTLLEKNTKK